MPHFGIQPDTAGLLEIGWIIQNVPGADASMGTGELRALAASQGIAAAIMAVVEKKKASGTWPIPGGDELDPKPIQHGQYAVEPGTYTPPPTQLTPTPSPAVVPPPVTMTGDPLAKPIFAEPPQGSLPLEADILLQKTLAKGPAQPAKLAALTTASFATAPTGPPSQPLGGLSFAQWAQEQQEILDKKFEEQWATKQKAQKALESAYQETGVEQFDQILTTADFQPSAEQTAKIVGTFAKAQQAAAQKAAQQAAEKATAFEPYAIGNDAFFTQFLATPTRTLKPLFAKQLGIPTTGRSGYQQFLADQWEVAATEYLLLGAGLGDGKGVLPANRAVDEPTSFVEYLEGRKGAFSSLQGDFQSEIANLSVDKQAALYGSLGAFGDIAEEQLFRGSARDQYPGFMLEGVTAQAFGGPMQAEAQIPYFGLPGVPGVARVDVAPERSFMDVLREEYGLGGPTTGWQDVPLRWRTTQNWLPGSSEWRSADPTEMFSSIR